MKLKINLLYKLAFTVILLLAFVFGGTLQYFIGIPNTTYTLILLSALLFLILFHILISRTFLFDRIFFWCFIYGLLITISGIINNSGFARTLLYFLFPLLPFSIFYLFKIFEKRNINIKSFLKIFFKYVVLLQLPIILIQKFGYNFLIPFNNSNQSINEYDFMFGSFFIRADHSLGFFLLIYMLNIIFKRKERKINIEGWGLITYITITVLLMESNLTKLILILIFGYYLFIWFYSKINLFGILMMVFVGYLLFNIALLIPEINGQFLFFKKKYTVAESQLAFDNQYAKRPQIVIVFAVNEAVKIIGDGPYNYFDIFTGKFKQTKHFSQLIWSYNDLGLLGLLTVIFLTYTLIKSLNLNRESNALLLLIFLMYLFMTNVYSDLAMMLSLLLIRNDKKKHLAPIES